ncbi:MAG: hypothetical protein Kow0099_00560 [Candidatus Abyssubacteria bacterium]
MADKITPTRLRLGLVQPNGEISFGGVTDAEADVLLSGMEGDIRRDKTNLKERDIDTERVDI